MPSFQKFQHDRLDCLNRDTELVRHREAKGCLQHGNRRGNPLLSAGERIANPLCFGLVGQERDDGAGIDEEGQAEPKLRPVAVSQGPPSGDRPPDG